MKGSFRISDKLWLTMTINYTPRGVCSRNIELTIENDIITGLKFTSGCNGNLQGIAQLAIGRNAREVAATIKGISCNGKGTSCPDQLAQAIDEYYSK